MKLFQGGCGNVKGYVVAEDERKAIQKLSDRLGIPFLPVEVTEVEVEGYEVTLTKKKAEPVHEVPTGEEGGVDIEPIREDGEQSKPEPGTETNGNTPGGKSRTRKKPNK